ncbi:MAG: hypothetical protein R3E97_18275 [Candidatus Eisenbacteria bacterium]
MYAPVWITLLVLHSTVASPTATATHSSLEPGRGVVRGGSEGPCGLGLELAFDGSAENGYAWHSSGIAPPNYGAFAAKYGWEYGACGIELILTSTADSPCRTLDAYLWQNAGGAPGAVLLMAPDLDPCPVAIWPELSVHDFYLGMPTENTCGGFWVGYWADFSQTDPGFYVAADLDGPGGVPYTNIAPGIGYPTGWNNVSVVWGPTQSLGIGAWLSWLVPIGACCHPDGSCTITGISECDGEFQGFCRDCDPNPCEVVPTTESSWGRIKAILRSGSVGTPR